MTNHNFFFAFQIAHRLKGKRFLSLTWVVVEMKLLTTYCLAGQIGNFEIWDWRNYEKIHREQIELVGWLYFGIHVHCCLILMTLFSTIGQDILIQFTRPVFC